jgi:glycosyltransferase involved in cell wall biosynthesis
MSKSLSVAMCTYNGAAYLRQQLDSIAAQTRPPDELVLCDDRSTDETVRIVEEFAAAAPFPVRLYVNERNLGVAHNFEKAVGLCEGELIALADQDDVWLPFKLARIAAEFELHPRVGLVFSDAELVDERLRPLGTTLWKTRRFDLRSQRLVRAGRALDVILPCWTVAGTTMAFRSKYRDLILDIPDNIKLIHDGWIALVIAAVAEVACLDEPLIKYRQHSEQLVGALKFVPTDPVSETKSGRFIATLYRTNNYVSLIERGLRLRQRLAERCGSFGCDADLEKLDDRLAHLQARADVSSYTFHRLHHVLRELFSGRYHRYSNGVYSALRDVLTRNVGEAK